METAQYRLDVRQDALGNFCDADCVKKTRCGAAHAYKGRLFCQQIITDKTIRVRPGVVVDNGGIISLSFEKGRNACQPQRRHDVCHSGDVPARGFCPIAERMDQQNIFCIQSGHFLFMPLRRNPLKKRTSQ